jgi:signal transduction histidine kinase
MCAVHTMPRPAPVATDECLATLAHELRDPLATILLALQAMPSPTDPDARQAHAIAEHQARHAVRMVDDLFDLCAGSWEKLHLDRELVELAAIVAQARETVRHALAKRDHHLTVTLPAKPIYLFGDPSRLVQVLTNLLGNAAKFTDPGGRIRLTVETEAGQAVLRVRDNGRGIPRDRLSRVFDPFWQDPRNRGKGTRGLGLGLALVKSLVEAHGGSVTARSDGPDMGAEFIIRLPACAAESAP